MPFFTKGKNKQERLSGGYFALFRMHAFFQLFWTLPYIFVNTFLISISSDIQVAYKFNIIIYLVQGFAMMAGSALVRRFSAKTIARIGIALYALSYLLLFIFKENSVFWMPLIAGLNGTAGGFYWLGYLLAAKHTTADSNRDKALGLIGTTTAAVQMVAPLCSGLLIHMVKGTAGYSAVFFLSFVFAVVTFFLAGRITVYHYEASFQKPLYSALLLMLKSKSLKFGLAAEFGRGLYDGAFYFVLNLLIFQLVRDELMVGLNSFIAGGAGILFNLLATRILRPSNRSVSIAAAASCLAVSTAVLGLFLNASMLIAVSVVNTSVLAFINIPNNSMYVNAIEKLGDREDRSPEMFAFREIWLNLGRTAGVCLLLFIPQSMGWCVAGLFVLSISQYLTAFFNHKAAFHSGSSRGQVIRPAKGTTPLPFLK